MAGLYTFLRLLLFVDTGMDEATVEDGGHYFSGSTGISWLASQHV
jgi:hypothetical protein